MKKNKKIDLGILALILIITAFLSLFYRTNFLISTLLLFGAPSLYLIIKIKKSFKKTFLFSLLLSLPLTFIFDYLITKDKGWHIISSVFPFRLFSLVAIEQFIWAFLFIFYIITFYEYFLDKKEHKSIFSYFLKTNKAITKRMEYFSLFLFALLVSFISLAFLSQEFLALNYSYLITSIILVVLPLSAFLFRFPNFLNRFTLITIYFFLQALITEYIGLKLNHWTFPGTHYLGMINFFGFPIPYEEIIFYFILSTPAVLSYYEFLDDDRK